MDIVITQDFFPLIGGAHLWLYEVYKRWPSKVVLLTQEYSTDPTVRSNQSRFDSLFHGSLEITRKDIHIENINLFAHDCLRKYARIFNYLHRIRGNEQVTFHCIRSFPEAAAAALYKNSYRGCCRLITYAHGEELFVADTSIQLKFLAKFAYSSSDLVIANSRFTSQLVRRLCPRAKILIIHPGVDANAFNISAEQRRAYRARWGWPDDALILITVSRMEPRKNHISVVRAVAELRKEGLPITYVIGGEGEERDRLAAEVRKLDLVDWVRFTGKLSVEDLALAYCAADIHVMPSIKVGEMIEGFGIVFLEAAAAGIPSISGKCGGQVEAVLDGRTGFVIDGCNLGELKQAIRLLVENPALRMELGANGKKWAAENDWSMVVAKTLAGLNSLHAGNTVS